MGEPCDSEHYVWRKLIGAFTREHRGYLQRLIKTQFHRIPNVTSIATTELSDDA